MIRTKWHHLANGIFSEHVFAVGDIHGHATALTQALQTIAQTPRSGKTRHLIFTGDTIDAGPENLRTAELVQRSASIAEVDKLTILPGNHEILLSKALNQPDDDLMFWALMGGQAVIEELDPQKHLTSNADIVRAMQRLPDYLRRDLSRVNGYILIDRVLFVHAGLSPFVSPHNFLNLRYDEELPAASHWSSIRAPFLEWRDGWDFNGPITVVHGHSPSAKEPIETAEVLAEKTLLQDSHSRINIDIGAGEVIDQVAMAEFLDNSVRIHSFR